MDVQQVFTSIDSLNQAIQPEVVGPLLKKGGKGGLRCFYFGIGFGTSIGARGARSYVRG